MRAKAAIGLGILAFILSADQRVSSLPAATFCRTCETHDPSARDDCYQTQNSQHKICTTNCITRFSYTPTGLRIQKGCADDATCQSEWWLSSSTRPACHRDELTRPGASLPGHVTCSVCCTAARDGNIHCNDDLFPPESTLVQFPDVVRPTFPSLFVTTPSVHASTPGDTIHQRPELTIGAIEDYPEPMVCGDCSIIDQDKKSSCGASTLCYGDKPLCMTSFFDDGHLHLKEVKRCAAVSECWDLWYNKTRLREDCMGDEDHDPYSWDGTKSGECHYCCHTPQGQAYSWCNQAMWPTKPENLVDMNDYQRRVLDPRKATVTTSTTPQPTTTPAVKRQTTEKVTTEQPTTKQDTANTPTTMKALTDYPEPMVCGDCSIIDQDKKSSCGASTLCYGDKPLCLTSFFDDGHLHLKEVKRCAAVSECWDLWYNKTRLREDCMGDAEHDPYSWDGTKSGECHYCCHTPQGQAYSWCNQAMWPTKPKNLVDMNDYQRRVLDPRMTTVKTSATPEATATQVAKEQTNDAHTSKTITTEQPTPEQVTTDVPTTEQPKTKLVAINLATTDQPTAKQVTPDKQTAQYSTTKQVSTNLPTTGQPTPKQVTTDKLTTKQATPKQVTTNLPTTGHPSTKQVTTNLPTTGQPTPKQVTTDKLTTKQATPKQVTTNLPITGHPSTKQVTTNLPTTGQPTPKQVTTDKLTTKQATPKQVTTNLPITGHPSTKQVTKNFPTTGQPTPKQVTTDKLTTKQATPKQVTTNLPTTGHPSTKQVTTNLPTTGQPTPEQVTTDKLTTKQATPKQVTTNLPTTGHPSTKQVTKNLPTTGQPTPKQVTIEKSTIKQATTDQVTTKNVISEASATEHTTSKQVAKEAITTEQPILKENSTNLPTSEQQQESTSNQDISGGLSTEQGTRATATLTHTTKKETTVQDSTPQITVSTTTEQVTAATTSVSRTTTTLETSTTLKPKEAGKATSTQKATTAQPTKTGTEIIGEIASTEPTKLSDNLTTGESTSTTRLAKVSDTSTSKVRATTKQPIVSETTIATTEAPKVSDTTRLRATAIPDDAKTTTLPDATTLDVSKTPPPTPRLRCEVCEASSGSLSSSSCQTGRVETCRDGLDYCINTVTFKLSKDGDPDNSISKKCASYQTCQSSNINQAICSGDLTDPTAFPPGTKCNFCCNDTSATGIPCNANIRPIKTIDFLPKTRTNTTINLLPTTPPAPVLTNRSCLQCGDPVTGKPCGPGDLLLGTSQPCPSGLDFCMNDIYEKAGDGKTIYKRCVAEKECKNKWFKESSDSPECTEYNPRAVVTSDLTCHFCCTSDGCNIPTKPDESTLWTPFYTGN